MKRGEVYWISSNPTARGSEVMKRRPGVIIQNNIGNTHSPTLIVAYLSNEAKAMHLPTHVTTQFGIIQLEQIGTIDKFRIGEKIGDLSYTELLAFNEALSVSVGLEKPKSFVDSIFEHMNGLEGEIKELDTQIINLIDKKNSLTQELTRIKSVMNPGKECKQDVIKEAPVIFPLPVSQTEQVINYIKEKGPCQADELIDHFQMTKQGIVTMMRHAQNRKAIVEVEKYVYQIAN